MRRKFLSLVAGLFMACAEPGPDNDGQRSEATESQQETGSMVLALKTTAGGNAYRIAFSGGLARLEPGVPPPTTIVNLDYTSDSAILNDTTEVTGLTPGSYQLVIYSYTVYREPAGWTPAAGVAGLIRVDAIMDTPNPFPIGIGGGQTSVVSLIFRLSNLHVTFDPCAQPTHNPICVGAIRFEPMITGTGICRYDNGVPIPCTSDSECPIQTYYPGPNLCL